MTHLKIEQNNSAIEQVSSAVITKLYKLATSGELDLDSNLVGRLSTTVTYLEYIDALHTAYPDLYISATGIYIMFEDPEVLNVLLANNIGDGVGVTIAQAANADLRTMFLQSTAITSFNNFDKFTYANRHETFFTRCTNLRSINLSNCLVLAQLMFLDCTSLESVNIGGPVTNVFTSVFEGCSNLQSLTLPSTLTLLSERFCNGCSKLSTLDLSHILSLGAYAMAGTKITTADLSSCTSILHEAFSGCSSLQSVTLSPQLNSIPMGTFKDCSSLSSIDLSNITSIGGVSYYGAFQGCSSLTSVTLTHLNSLGDYAFKDCSAITTVDLSNSPITKINALAFYGCTNLTSIDLSNISILESNTFVGCTSLTSIDLSSITVFSSGYTAGYSNWGAQFLGCTSISSVTLPLSGGIFIPSKCFEGCPITNINLEGVGSMANQAFNQIQVDPLYLPNATILDGCCLPKENTIKNYYFNSVVDLSLYNTTDGTTDLYYYYNNDDDYRSYCFFKSWAYLDKSIDVMYFRDLLSLSCFALQFCTIQHLIINNTTPPTLIGNNGDANDNVQNHIFYKCNIDNLYVPDSAVTAYLTAWSGTAINKSGSTYSLLNIIKPLSQCPKKTLAEVLNGLIGLIEAYM